MKDEVGIVEPAITEYLLGDQSTDFMIKNNLFVSIEEFREDEKNTIGPLSSTDTQILTTTFLMAHELNENRVHYDAETVFKIDLDKFCKLWKIEISDDDKKSGLIYHNIKNSLSRLQSRIFRYLDLESNAPVQSSYFAYIEYGNRTIKFGFPKPFIQYLKKMDKFTWYYLENIIKLGSDSKQYAISSYAVTLYENLQKEKNFAPIEDGKKIIIFGNSKLRKLFGITSGYERNIDFKNKVLLPSLKLIEKHTQLKVTLQGIKEGKEITKYRFICEFPERDLDFAYAVSKKKSERPLLTAQQRKKFSKLLTDHLGFHSIYIKENELNKDFMIRVEKKLMDKLTVIEYWPFLKAVGCRSKKIENLVTGEVNKQDVTPDLKF